MSAPPKPPVSPPLIHITLQTSTVRAGVALIASVALLSLGALGLASSPIVDGHPVLLTPERMAIKTYLDAALIWMQQLDTIDQHLALIEVVPAVAVKAPFTSSVIAASPIVTGVALAITMPAAIPLPTLAPPISWPDNLYDRAQQADQLTIDLAVVDRDQQQIDVPPALTALHSLARSAVQAYGQYAASALDVIGAPVPANIAALQNIRATAQATLADFRAALAVQREEVR